jgi:hypothetical protein
MISQVTCEPMFLPWNYPPKKKNNEPERCWYPSCSNPQNQRSTILLGCPRWISWLQASQHSRVIPSHWEKWDSYWQLMSSPLGITLWPIPPHFAHRDIHGWINCIRNSFNSPPQGPPSRSDWPRSSTKTSSPASAKAAAAAQPEAPPPMMIQSAASGAAAGFAHWPTHDRRLRRRLLGFLGIEAKFLGAWNVLQKMKTVSSVRSF